MIIAVDPGHGGDDPGATGIDPEDSTHRVTEAELNWTLAGWIKLILEEEGHSAAVTRQGLEDGPSLAVRAKAAAGCHCLVSIHHNAAESPGARGFEIFVHKPEDGEVRERDMALASLILEACRPTLDVWWIPLRNPPIKADVDWASRGRLTLLAEAEVPACLIEICFMSNPLELLAALQTGFQVQMAQAITRGIIRFGKEVLHVL